MKPGYYDHLNETDPVQIELSMEQLVSIVMKMNYGQQRFLSELLRQRKISHHSEINLLYRDYNNLLEDLLKKGFF